MKPTLVVLAAGLGSRYGGLKQMDTFGPSGETIVEYTIYDAIEAGFEKVVFIIRKSIEQEFRNTFGTKLAGKADIRFVFQEIDNLPEGFTVPEGREKPWGTAHAVLMAKETVNEPFAIVNADDFYGKESFKIMYNYLIQINPDELAASMVGYVLKNTLSDHGKVSRGVCQLDEQSNLTEITERTDIYRGEATPAYYVEGDKKHNLTGEEMVSMNLIGFSPRVFSLIESEFKLFLEARGGELKSEFYIPSILDKLRENGYAVPVLPTRSIWFGVTYKEDKISARKKLNILVNEGLYPDNLWE